MRNRFNEQLEQLNVELIKMGALCEEAISAATKAYVEGDRELGERARSLEQDIDHKERDIESQCMKLLLRQQPVAKEMCIRDRARTAPSPASAGRAAPAHGTALSLSPGRRTSVCSPRS